MWLLPGSHRVALPVRFTPFDSSVYDRFRDEIVANSICPELTPGQAIIYDSALVHYSGRNRSDEVRLACGCVFVPEEAEVVHYFKAGTGYRRYTIDGTFFHDIVPGNCPAERFPYEPVNVDTKYDAAAVEACFKQE